MLREAITRYTRYKKPNLVVEKFPVPDYLRRHQTTISTHADSVCHARCPKSRDPKIHARFPDVHTDVLISR